MLDFTLTEAQRALQQQARAFARGPVAGAAAVYSKLPDQRSRFRSTRSLYRAAWSGGLIKGQIPVPLGGTAKSLLDATIVIEELYAVDPSVTINIMGTGLGLTPIIMGASPEQRERFLAPFLEPEGDALASLVHSEPGGTANWLEKGGKGLQTTARQEGDSWIINGEKLWATNNGGWDDRGAAIQCVVCRVVQTPDEPQDPSADPASLIVILVATPEDHAANSPGAYEVLSHPELAGHVATSGPHSRYTNFRVQARNKLAGPGREAARLVEQTFGTSAALVGAMATAIQRAAFDAALDFARRDVRGGALPIVHHQSPADLLIDVKMRTETSRLLTWKAMHYLENGPVAAGDDEGAALARLELALAAKVYTTDAAVQSVLDAMKVVGMRSYNAEDMPFARLLNDAACLPLFDGGNVGVRRRQIQKIFAGAGYEPWAASLGA